jgi:HK97 gp10 family phage protein
MAKGFTPNRKLEAELRAYLARRLVTVGELVRDQVVMLLSQTGNVTGHTPSLPGQPPATVTGTLRASILSETDKLDLVVYIGVDASSPANKYAAALEFGTSRIQPRPFLRPAIVNTTEQIKRKITE